MLQLVDKNIKFDALHCQQCGACQAVCPKQAISFSPMKNGLQDIIVNSSLCILCKKCTRVCPANRVSDLDEDAYLRPLADKRYFLVSNADLEIRALSSSGGATKTLIIEALKMGLVDGVYSLHALPYYPSAEGEFYTRENIPSYENIPNSVYHSVMACKDLYKVKKVNRLMIVGTSCQLYAMEKTLKGKYNELIKVCLFCKQQKTLDSTRWLAKVTGKKLPENLKFSPRYRGEGWPGNLRVMANQLPWNRAAGLPFGRRLWSVPGCDICGDPFGIEVMTDLTVMDPWKIAQPNGLGETLVTCHTELGYLLLHKVKNLNVEKIDFQSILPALGIEDIWRKRKCIPYFLNKPCSSVVLRAARLEVQQRKCLEHLLNILPNMPFIVFRLLNRALPIIRDKVLPIDFKF